MPGKTKVIFVLLAAAPSLFATPGFAAGACNPNQPLTGATLFADNCASCHGADATGGATPSHVAAPDLTALSRQANGKFPAPRVADIIRYGGALADHSINAQMPIWAKIFNAQCGPTYSRRVVVELMRYVEHLQK